MSHPLDAQILKSVLRELTEQVQLQITDASAAAVLAMNLRLIEFLIAGGHASGTALVTDAGPEADLAELLAAAQTEAVRLEAVMQPASDPADHVPASPVTAEQLTPYLHARCDKARQARVVEIVPSAGGFSKETYLVRLENADLPGIAIRRDPDGGPVERKAAEEFAILSAAYRSGVPVPEPLWADPASPFGRSIVATALVSGRSPFDATGTRLGVGAQDAALGLARVLALVHRIPLVETGASDEDARASVQEHVRRMLEQLEDQWKRRRVWDSAILRVAFAWMRGHIPAQGSAAVVHGDASLRNLLVDDGRVTALLDWELWHIGDPAEDLAYCRPDVEQAVPWERFLEEYRAHGGIAVWNQRVADYYGMWASLRNAVLSGCGMHGFVHAQRPESRMAFAGIVHHRHLVADVARRLSALASG